MYSLTLLNRVLRRLIYPIIGCSFLVRPAGPGWPGPAVGWDSESGWLLICLMSRSVTRIQVQAHEFNQHQPRPCQKPFYHPLPLAPCRRAGVDGGSCPPGQCCAGAPVYIRAQRSSKIKRKRRGIKIYYVLVVLTVVMESAVGLPPNRFS